MAKAPKIAKLPTAKPIGIPEDDEHYGVGANLPAAGEPDAPVPGVIDPEADPASNQVESPIPSSEMPTGPLPPNATTVATVETDEDDGKGKPQTAQEAVDRLVPEGEYANDEHRQKAMKRWPNLFAETAKK